jgi:chromosome segregation ATPase
MAKNLDESMVQMSPRKQTKDDATQLEEVQLAYIEHLLTAVERLRVERNSLRSDLSFLEAESKFALDAMEAKLATPISAPQLEDLRTQLANATARHDAALRCKEEEVRRLALAATASMVVIGHIQSQALDSDDQYASVSTGLISAQAQLEDARAACAAKDRKIVEITEQLSELEVRCNVTSLDLEAAAAQRTKLFATIKRLEGKEVEWALETRRATDAKKAMQEMLDQTSVQLSKVTQSLEEAEAQRDALNLQLTNLEFDLKTAQQELHEAQDRYSTLQAHQLSAMSSGGVTRVLREQIEELEGRILRRTEQIGILQHDIKRLEMNMKLQEERLTEMTAELEMSAAEKAAMVEDCADARDARDEALRQVEWLEVEVEVQEDQLADVAEQVAQREAEMVTMVELFIGSTAKAKEATRTVLHHHHNEARLIQRAEEAENNHTQAVADLEQLSDEHERTLHLLEEQAATLDAAESHGEVLAADVTQITLALAVSCVESQALKRITADLGSRTDLLEDKLKALDQEHSKAVSNASDLLAARTSELELELIQLRCDREQMVSRHQEDVRELEARLVESEQTLPKSMLDEELSRLGAQHRQELRSLQERLEQASAELQGACQGRAEAEARCQLLERSRNDLETQHRDLSDDLARTKETLNARQAEIDERTLLVRELEDSVTKQGEQMKELQARLEESIGALHEVKHRMCEEADDHAGREELSRKELQFSMEKCQRAESIQAELRLQLSNACAESETLRSEKDTLQREMTGLEAEIQRSMSLQRYLESQAKDRYDHPYCKGGSLITVLV